MSTLEKTIHLLQKAPEHTIETVFAYLQSVLEQQSRSVASSTAFGIAHQYANPALMEQGSKKRRRFNVLWSKSMKLIDANVILRYLLNDNPEMAEKAKNIVESSDNIRKAYAAATGK